MQDLPWDLLRPILERLSPWDCLSLTAAVGRHGDLKDSIRAYVKYRRDRNIRFSDIKYDDDILRVGDAVIGVSGQEVSAILCSLFLTLRELLPSVRDISGASEAMRGMQTKSQLEVLRMPQIELYWYTAWYLMVVAAHMGPLRVTAHQVTPLPLEPTVLPEAAQMVVDMVQMALRGRYYEDRKIPSLENSCIDPHICRGGSTITPRAFLPSSLLDMVDFARAIQGCNDPCAVGRDFM